MASLASRFVSPTKSLYVQLTVIVSAVSLSVLLMLVTLGSVIRGSEQSANESQRAFMAADLQDSTNHMLGILNRQAEVFLADSILTTLDAGSQNALRNELLRLDDGPGDPNIPALEIRLPYRDEITFLQLASATLSSGNALQSPDGLDNIQSALDGYFQNPTVEAFQHLRFALSALELQAHTETPGLEVSSYDQSGELVRKTKLTLLVLVGVSIFLGCFSFMVTFISGRRSVAALLSAQAEKEASSYSNNQLSALYRISSEISESLSLNYVISTALHEAVNLARADIVVLRLLKQHELLVGGSLSRTGEAVEGLTTLQLGEGSEGQVARRGKTVRVDRKTQAPKTEALWLEGMESCLIVPLIVGARVVGTLGCWSSQLNTFTDGDQRVLEMMASAVATSVVAADSTESSERRAHHDPLTDLPNRLQLSDDMAGYLNQIVEDRRRAVVGMLDIDHFKHFNDEFGHHVGDVTLQKVAAVLRHAVRQNDRVYRYGGEEFVIVFVDAGLDEAIALADRVRTAVESTPLTGDSLEPIGPVTVSIGLALLPDHANDLGVLIELADQAMYESKEAGRNRVTVWSGPPSSALVAA